MKTVDTVFNFLVIPTIKYALSHGISSEAQIEILQQDITNPDFTDIRISPDQYTELITAIKSTVNDANMGLHIGEMLRISSLGILGYVLMNCQNIAQVSDKLLVYQELAGNFVNLSYNTSNNQATIRLSVSNERLIPVRREILIGMLTGVAVLHEELTGKPLLIENASFSWPAPADLSEYNRIFKSRLLFNQQHTGLAYDIECQKRPVLFANSKLLSVFEKHAIERYRELNAETHYSNQVLNLLGKKISEMPGLDSIAFSLGMSGKTLHSKLKQEQTSFSELRDKVRCEYAKSYLQQHHYSTEKICLFLGFSEPSAFYRAFKRWTGMSVKEYRSKYPAIDL